MPRRPPRDPTKPPRIVTRVIVVGLVGFVALVITSRWFFAQRTHIPGDANGSESILAQAGTRWIDRDPTKHRFHLRCLCLDGTLAEKTLDVTFPAGSGGGDPCYYQFAMQLNARTALFHWLGFDSHLPFLRGFRVGYEVGYYVHGTSNPADLAAIAELDAWVRTGSFASPPYCLPIQPPTPATLPSGQLVRAPLRIYPADVLISGIAGISATYLSIAILGVVSMRGIRVLNWHSRRRLGLCVTCGYPVTFIVGGRCPECGTPRVPSSPTPTVPH